MEKYDNLQAAIRAHRAGRPIKAEQLCREYLVTSPGCGDHIRLLGHALQAQGRLREAEEQLRRGLQIKPNFPQMNEDLGSVLAQQGRYDEAIELLQRAVQLDPTQKTAHRKLATALAVVGRGEEADESFEDYFDKAPDDARLAEAGNLLKAGESDEAIDIFKQLLKQDPRNVNAMRFLAVAYWKEKKHLDDAEALLLRAVELAPDYALNWVNLGMVQLERNKYPQAVESWQKATVLEPDNAYFWGGLGNACAMANLHDQAARAYARAVEISPENFNAQMGYAHVLKTLGRQDESLQAYRAAISHKPDFGEVYWSMANLKVFEFEPGEVEAMQQQLENPHLSDSAEIHFRFALGKAFEDRKDYEAAWRYYHSGNEKQRMQVRYDPLENEARMNRIRDVFTHEFIEQHQGQGFDAPDPIFIVGLPRSGSTLVEQILASHSMVEGTAELPNMSRIANSIGRYRMERQQFPESARDLSGRDWRAYGKQYIDETRRFRELGRPLFTDKLPNNFPLVGLIHLVLPNAKIINTRRHPLDSCLGAYKQLFGKGQDFTYDLYDLADYYRNYVAMMDHWQEVLPGKVLDVHYEENVLDFETQVRRILAHCGLPFEQQCLRFWETERAVRTASSEQVRQPIYTGALGKWRRYDPHLEVWKEQLAPIIDRLPDMVRNAGA
jgi:tetratricopeptide (TPR) repeat protein